MSTPSERGIIIPRSATRSEVAPTKPSLELTDAEREIFQHINITLVGLPGTGKSTVGESIAKQTGMKSIDTDGLVEAKTGKPVGEFIDERKRPAFYIVQDAELRSALVAREGQVIGTGGAIVEDDRFDNLGFMRMHSDMVYMNTKVDTLVARIMQDDTYRPDLSHNRIDDGDGNYHLERKTAAEVRAELINRHNRRHTAWENAHISVSTDNLAPDQVAEKIIQEVLKLEKKKAQNSNRFSGTA
jgi:shikimate kinase